MCTQCEGDDGAGFAGMGIGSGLGWKPWLTLSMIEIAHCGRG